MKPIKLQRSNYFFLLIFATLILVRIFSDFNGLYGQDSHEYFRYSKRLADFFQNGTHPGDYFWPINFPLYGAFFSFLIPWDVFARQLVSLLSFVLIIFYTYRMIRFYHSKGNQQTIYVYLGLVLFPSPFLFQSAFLVMSDMLATVFSIAAIFHILQYHRKVKTGDFLLAVFFSVSAVMTRYPTAILLLLPVVLLIFTFAKNFRFTNLSVAVLITIICLLPHFLIRGWQSGDFLGHQWLQTWSVKNWFLSEFTTVDGYQNYTLPNIVYGFSNFFYPGFMFLGMILIFFFRKQDFKMKELWILVASTGLSALFMAGIPFQNMRFLMPSFPLAVVLLFPAFQRFSNRFLRQTILKTAFFIGVVIIQILLIFKYSATIYQANRLEKQIAASMLAYPNRPIYTFSTDPALRSYGIESEIINLWRESLTEVDSTALILFNEQAFSRQWEGKNPMINWRFIQENYELNTLERLPNGWELCEIRD